MTEDIIKAVCAVIYGLFGDGYKIYTEAVAQDADAPCFFVLCTTPSINRRLGDEYFQKTPVIVQYLPQNDEEYRTECTDVFEKLSLNLDMIPLEDSYIHGLDLHGEIIDGVLNFYVRYDTPIVKTKEPTARMEKIEITQELKGG